MGIELMDAMLRKWYFHDKGVINLGSRIDIDNSKDEDKETTVDFVDKNKANTPAQSCSAKMGRSRHQKLSTPLPNTSP